MIVNQNEEIVAFGAIYLAILNWE